MLALDEGNNTVEGTNSVNLLNKRQLFKFVMSLDSTFKFH